MSTAAAEREPHAAEAHTGHNDPVGARFGMWLFLLTEILLFGGLFILYAAYALVYRKDFLADSRELNRVVGAANTVILLTSSLTMALSVAALQRGRGKESVLLLAATIVLALAFLVNKYFEWTYKFAHGIYPGSPALLKRGGGDNIFYGLYFVMTGLHGLHVAVGGVLLTVMLVFIARGTLAQGRHGPLECSGLYWHLVDIIWIFLFPLFYLIS